MLKIEKFTVIQTSVNFSISTYIFSDHITPEMPKLCRVTKVKAFFPMLAYIFNLGIFNVFEFSTAILEKGLFAPH